MKKIFTFFEILANSKVNTIPQDEKLEILKKLNSKELSFRDYIKTKIKSLEKLNQ